MKALLGQVAVLQVTMAGLQIFTGLVTFLFKMF
jgi:hypothetical protein